MKHLKMMLPKKKYRKHSCSSNEVIFHDCKFSHNHVGKMLSCLKFLIISSFLL